MADASCRRINRISMVILVIGVCVIVGRWRWNQEFGADRMHLSRDLAAGNSRDLHRRLEAQTALKGPEIQRLLGLASFYLSRSRQTVSSVNTHPTVSDREAVIHVILDYVVSRPPVQALDAAALQTAAEEGLVPMAHSLLRRGAVITPEALVGAAQTGRIEAVELMLHNGANPNVASQWGVLPLCGAVRGATRAHTLVARLLIEGGADIHAGAPLVQAAACRPETVRLLLAKGACVNAADAHGQTALMSAARSGNAAIVRILLAAGADPNIMVEPGLQARAFALRRAMAAPENSGNRKLLPGGECALSDAALSGNPEVIRLLIAHGARPNRRAVDGSTALHAVCRQALLPSLPATLPISPNAVELLLHAGADARSRDAVGRTPLHLAAAAGDAALPYVRGLLAVGAANAADDNGDTPLMEAVRSSESSSQVCAMLLAHGGSVTAIDRSNNTALSLAVKSGKLDDARLLLQHGADPNHRNALGQTPLIIASSAIHARAELITLLLSHGCDVHSRDDQGATALDMVIAHHRKLIIPLLQQASLIQR